MKVMALLPARLNSKRLPGKMLLPIAGEPLLKRVYDRVKNMPLFDELMIATDSPEIEQAATGWGAKVVMTPADLPSGTARAAYLAQNRDFDFYINIQSDMPLVEEETVALTLKAAQNEGAPLTTPVWKITSHAELIDPANPKVMLNSRHRALYISRSPIPFMRDYPMAKWVQQRDYWGTHGIYVYTRELLARYPQLLAGSAEKAESLEQLRFLEAGIEIYCPVSNHKEISVDTPDDIARVEAILAAGHGR